MTSRTPRRLAGPTVATALIAVVVAVVPTAGPADAAPTATGSITGSGYVSGPRSGVFRDIDSDGIWDGNEPGQGGITVTATCIADDGTDASSFDDVYGAPTTTTTAADGSFALTGPDVRGLCRVEFAIPSELATVLQPGVATGGAVAPDSAGSFVQFVDATAGATVTTAVHNPGAYTGSTSSPDVVTGLALPGSSDTALNPIAATYETVLRTDYGLGAPSTLATGDETGAIWGIAWEPATETVFAAAVVKRHSGMGPAGPDAIYAIGPDVPAAWATPFTATDVDGGAVQSNAARGLRGAARPSDDDLAFTQAGTIGWGDLDVTEDGRTLYGVNLRDKTLQPIDVATKAAGTPIAIPDPGCADGSARPWGIEIHDGLVYAGVVCDASRGTVADLAAFVYAYNPTGARLPLAGVPSGLAPGAWSANLVDDDDAAPGIQLDYPKGCTVPGSGCAWNAWDDTYTDAEFLVRRAAIVKPQPILSDLEIDDDGSLILAFADRVGFQFGFANRRPQSTDQRANVEGVVGGDVLRASRPAATGTFVLERGGTVAIGTPRGGGAYTGAANGQGPGGGEVYSHEQWRGYHFETSLGSLAKVPGRVDYLLGVMDPFDAHSGGIGTFPVNGTARTDAIELYDSAGGDGVGYGFGKGSGLADIEVLTQLAPVEVGNRVWRDDNANGVQDAGEPPIPGVEVTLTIGAATYTATTDGTGQYLFSSVPRTGATTAPLLAAENYRFDLGDDAATISIADATGAAQQTALAGLSPTEANDAAANAPNVGGSNANDSDGVPAGTDVAVTFTLGALAATNDANAGPGDSVDREGFNRHIFDFGFVPAVSLGNRVWFDTDNDSTIDAGEQPVAGVAVELFWDSDANGVIDPAEETPVARDTTDGNGLYYFDQFTDPAGSPLAVPRLLTPGNYVVGIAPSNFTAAGPLAGYHSSGTTLGAAGAVSETAASDPDGDVNTDDDGTRQASGSYAGGVLSQPVTVTHGAEPTGEESGAFDNNGPGVPDANSNLTVDFGFYRVSVGDTVWIDDGRGGGDDDDGVQNGGEPGLDGVPVRLYASDGVTQIPVGPDGVLGTADDGLGAVLTTGGGRYSFDGLPEGTYVVQIDAPVGYRSSTDPADGAAPLSADVDDNGTGTLPGTITSAPFTLVAGSATDGHVADDPTGTTSNPRVDFGLVANYDLTILKTVTSTGPYGPGSPVTYSVVASNLGPGIALDGLTVTDRLPVGLGYDAVTPAIGTEWICAAPVGLEVTCTWEGPTPGLGNDVLAAGAAAPAITVNAVVDTPVPIGPLVNFAVVEPSPDQTIPEDIPVGTTPDRYEDGNPGTGSNNDDSGSIAPVPVYSLGDLMWIDADRDGRYDAGEAPVVGAQVELLDGAGAPATDAFGNPVLAATTDASGRYQFDDLAEGDYRVRFTLPSGFVWTAPDTGDDGLDSDALPASADAPTATTATFTLTSTPVADADTDPNRRLVTDPTIDAGVVPIVSLGDLVWVDADGDGQFDGAEAPLPGVRVDLLDASGTGPAIDALGNPVAFTTTDANGRYQFDGLLPGDHRVQFTLPVGYVWTVSNTGGDGLDSDAVFTDRFAPAALTDVVSLTGTAVVDSDTSPFRRIVTDPTIDAGVVPLVSLGDLVWIDADQDGQFDPSETPIEGVTVTLLDASLAPAVGAGGATVAPATTDANGRYSFTNLVPGDYVVRFTLPAGFAWTLSDNGPDGLDSDATYASRLQPTADTAPFTLTATPVTDPDASPFRRIVTDPTIDAGVVPVVSLGDVVWIDVDRNGVYDPAELPAPLVVVRLLNAAGTAPAVGADGLPVASVATDADGRYSFTGLLPGDYVVEFVLPSGFGWTAPNAGADDGQDSDAVPASPTAATARTAVVGLTATDVPDSDTRPSARAVTNPTIDAGIVPIVSLGDVVWIDGDGDGVYDPTESPIEGITVSLLDADGTPVTDVSGNTVTPTTTDADGRYSFEDLVPGRYQVVFTLPAGYAWARSNQGADDGLDSDVVPASPSAPTASTAVFTLSPTPVTDTDPNPSRRAVTNPTIDAAVVPIVSLGDVVWVDEDGDGAYDPTEDPLPGVTVELLDASGAPASGTDGNPVPATTTDADGRYSFDALVPGSYRVRFTLPPEGFIWTTPNAGADDSLDSDVSPPSPTAVTATTDVIVLTDAAVPDNDPDPSARDVTNPTIDAGVQPVVSVGDLVWIDDDRDGTFDPAERPLSGVVVRLLGATGAPVRDATGVVVTDTVTDADGRYSFERLLPGDYQIVFVRPDNYRWTVSNTGSDGLDSDAVPTTPAAPTASTGVFRLSSTPVLDPDGNPAARVVTNPTLDAGLVPLVAVGDYVWRDRDRDGTQDPGEPPVPGVTVTLLNPDGTRALDANGELVPVEVTDATGRYVIDNLLPGSYVVQFGNLPTGYVFTTQGAGGGADSNPVVTTGRTPVFTIGGSDPDTRPVTPADGTALAALINPTIDAGIIDPVVDGLPPTTTTPGTTTTTTPPPTTRPTSSVGLPRTGAELASTLGWALSMALLGVVLVGVARRRRSTSP